ncbi:CLUMA_CG008284, isoform A [Clunio marinus]|uniref:CLUMA_CG008284, isoform A n=1 Tax=Clunio marinus TaxID=568069 RepID=A0A1J1I765_9DIPT|nr:CLUMA_CG008284, isoform A [Clunio marinus]
MIVIQDENANRDNNEIAAIFNPKRVRTPSVVITTGESPNGPSQHAATTNLNQITHSDSVTSSQPDGAESLTGIIIGDNSIDSHSHHQPNSLTQIHQHQLPRSASTEQEKPKGCKGSCCSELAQKMYFGVCVTILITFFWVTTTHCFKFLFLPSTKLHHSLSSSLRGGGGMHHHTTTSVLKSLALPYSSSSTVSLSSQDNLFNENATTRPSRVKSASNEEFHDPRQFRAPFFASWFCTNFVILFFPIYLLFRGLAKRCGANTETLGDILQGFRDRGFTVGRFINRCVTFCILWVAATYLYMKSLNVLLSTDVIVLFATNVASVYLLSWVILHEQFVGVRIVAVILVDTGIALLAYMDGINGSKTLTSVVLAALSGAGYAVFRVMFRKMMGDPPPVGRIAFTFTIIGIINAALLWPVCLILGFFGLEVMPWETLTITVLLIASVLLLIFHILTQFSGAVTYNMFVTLGLITSVPVSASLDILLYGAEFAGMKLGGIILISVGFFLVMFPNNWPDYITRLLRNIILLGHNARWSHSRSDYLQYIGPIDYRTGYIRSQLRSPSGRVRIPIITKMAIVNTTPVDLNINMPNLTKIEKMLNDSSYSELIEFSANFNTRLCVERRLRMPFLDPQTGVAQKHSNLFMKKSQRIPGLRDGQIYTYPSARWRKAKRQYLTNANAYPFNYRPFGRFRENDFEHSTPVGDAFIPSEESSFRPGMTEDSHSKDSHKEDNSKSGWYYDEMDIHDMDNFEDPEEDSDDDFMEPRSGRKKRSSGRTPGSSSRRSGKEKDPDNRRGRNTNRGGRGRKVNPPPMDNSSNSSDKFNEYSRRRPANPPQVTTTHNPNPMSFDEAIPEHKIPTTERGKTHFEDDRMGMMSSASTSQHPMGLTSALLGSPTKMNTSEKTEKPRANPSTYCDFCLGDARENKKTGQPEELVSCSDCGRSGHPTCLQFTENMIISVKKYRWQCIECKCCSICGTSENDERLLFCDSCDAGFHMYCLSPPLENPPEGSWDCKSCIETFYSKK